MNDKDKSDHLKASALSIHVVRMLKGIPEDLLSLFAPQNVDDAIQFELNIARFKARENERDAVMRLQRKAGLPLRPNMPLNRCMIFIRLAELKRRKGKGNSESDYNPFGGSDH